MRWQRRKLSPQDLRHICNVLLWTITWFTCLLYEKLFYLACTGLSAILWLSHVSPFLAYIHWRVQVSMSCVFIGNTGPWQVSKLLLMSSIILGGLPIKIRFSVNAEKLHLMKQMRKRPCSVTLCTHQRLC